MARAAHRLKWCQNAGTPFSVHLKHTHTRSADDGWPLECAKQCTHNEVERRRKGAAELGRGRKLIRRRAGVGTQLVGRLSGRLHFHSSAPRRRAALALERREFISAGQPFIRAHHHHHRRRHLMMTSDCSPASCEIRARLLRAAGRWPPAPSR
jgi:hypothetical protein